MVRLGLILTKEHVQSHLKLGYALIIFQTDNYVSRPEDALVITETAHAFGIDVPKVIDHYQQINQLSLSEWIYNGADFQLETDFALHLEGLRIVLLRDYLHRGDLYKLNKAASILVSRTSPSGSPKNPFFLYLRDGKTEQVWNLVSKACPAIESDIPKSRSEWAWQRPAPDKPNDPEEDAWKKSSLWDCIFMAKLLLME